MKVKELIEALKSQNPDAPVYVDWDCEGGSESEVSRIEPLSASWLDDKSAIALR